MVNAEVGVGGVRSILANDAKGFMSPNGLGVAWATLPPKAGATRWRARAKMSSIPTLAILGLLLLGQVRPEGTPLDYVCIEKVWGVGPNAFIRQEWIEPDWARRLVTWFPNTNWYCG
jgi:hypothetical protein